MAKPDISTKLGLSNKLLQAIITIVVGGISAYAIYHFNTKLEVTKLNHQKELKIFQDSLANIRQQKLLETRAIAALKIDVEIAKILYELIIETGAQFAHYSKVHNGGLELHPTRPKYITILSEVTALGTSDIKEYYQSRPINTAALNTYANAITNHHYIINNFNDPVFSNDAAAIDRLKAINVNSIIVYYVGHINEELLFVQLSFNEKDIGNKKSGLIKNMIIDQGSKIETRIREFNLKYGT